MYQSWLAHWGKQDCTSYTEGTLTQTLDDDDDDSGHISGPVSRVLFESILFLSSGLMWDAEGNIWEWNIYLLGWHVEVFHLGKWSLASWTHHYARHHRKASFHMNSDILTWFCRLGISGINAKSLMLSACVWGNIDIFDTLLFSFSLTVPFVLLFIFLCYPCLILVWTTKRVIFTKTYYAEWPLWCSGLGAHLFLSAHWSLRSGELKDFITSYKVIHTK